MGLTFGRFSVDSILGWDETVGRIYFTAPGYDLTTEEAIPSQTHLWFTNMKSDGDGDDLVCMTCSLKTSAGEPCLGNSAELSTEASHFVHTCNGGPFSPPEVAVRSTKNPETVILRWTSNTKLRQRLATFSLPEYKDYEIQLPAEAGNPYKIRARVLFPPNMTPSKKYPLLVDVYGGPGSQRISNTYGIDWSTSLVSSHSVIYASIDGRGSGRQSDDLKFQVYRKLGTVEVYDQINGGDWLINNIPSIDPNRTALWGWSYGGFATAMAMGLDSIKNVYKCGISVAPVTNWLLYDTIYTERYMGLPTPDDNLSAYNASDVTHYVSNFRNKKFYLVHGNADDNVHYQQSMILSRALERADILFRQQSYPDESHGLSGVRPHLYHSLENFLFEECFN
jgi:dipeptidyl-peptidase-4